MADYIDREAADKLAAYEDAEERGRLVARDMLGKPHYDRTQTNADRIRAMTDEKLAKEIAWLIVEAMKQLHPLAKWKIEDSELIRGTAEEMLDWLKLEAEG